MYRNVFSHYLRCKGRRHAVAVPAFDTDDLSVHPTRGRRNGVESYVENVMLEHPAQIHNIVAHGGDRMGGAKEAMVSCRPRRGPLSRCHCLPLHRRHVVRDLDDVAFDS